MGVYINMEMPKNCMLCPLCVEEADPANGEMCMVTGTLMPPCTRERLDNCPLVPVPPHGRCVDADKLMQEIRLFIKENMLSRDDARELLETIEDAPTIIPAEEGE